MRLKPDTQTQWNLSQELDDNNEVLLYSIPKDWNKMIAWLVK